ncbi:hypothetical protein FN846DRAFT_914325 [Sphaerosporella brunnea]|uniref:Uncharacterized protein n=1 Tax=Sphaerosporella brunnea TaxID=1250544 RepID=A0A5J5EE58_9PEZI|nr:hypothetical protein FN846DRAFT_914325 [Sphaerosporella brunnea]
MPKEVKAIWLDLTRHCKDNHGFGMGIALKHWNNLKVPEEHKGLSVVPNKTVYIDMWPANLQSHSEVLQDMQATVKRAMDTLRKGYTGESFETFQETNQTLVVTFS